MLAAVAAVPGAGTRAVGRVSGVPFKMTGYHLGILARVGLVESVPDGGTIRHFPASMAAGERVRATLMRAGLWETYCVVAAYGPLAQRAAIERLGVAPATAQDRLRRLIARGAVRVQRRGRQLMHHAVPLEQAVR